MRRDAPRMGEWTAPPLQKRVEQKWADFRIRRVLLCFCEARAGEGGLGINLTVGDTKIGLALAFEYGGRVAD